MKKKNKIILIAIPIIVAILAAMFVPNIPSTSQLKGISNTTEETSGDVKKILSQMNEYNRQYSFEGFYETIPPDYKHQQLDQITIHALQMAFELRRNHEYDKSITQYDIVLDRYPNNLQALVGKKLSLDSIGKSDEAAVIAKQLVSLNVHSLATSQKNNRQIEIAKNTIELGLAVDPDNPVLLTDMGDLIVESEAPEEGYESAHVFYDKALSIDPNYENTIQSKVHALEFSGITHLNLKNYETALSYYERALEFSPNSTYSLTWAPNALFFLERYDEAIELSDKALEIIPNYPLARFHKGLSFYALEKYNEAIIEYDHVLDDFPQDHLFLYHKAWALIALNNYDEALENLDKAIESVPDYTHAIELRKVVIQKIEN